MRVLTVWQPYASLIIEGYKGYETRSYMTTLHERIAIHAAKYHKLPHETYVQIAEATGLSIEPGSWLYYMEHGIPSQEFGAILGTVGIGGGIATIGAKNAKINPWFPKKEFSLGDYSDGRWAWQLDNPVKLDRPIPAKGKQGFWRWNDETALKVG